MLKNAFLIITATLTVFFSCSATAGTITGVINYQGERPKLREIKMDADPVCLTKHTGTAVYPQTITLGPNMEMKNVFVQVVQGIPSQAYPVPSEPVVLDQKGCIYDPAVVGVRSGQPVKFLNPDGTLHNVHALSKINPEFNIAMPKFRTETEKIFDKPEFMFEVKCDVHPWMVAHITVLNHPFFSVTGDDGRFTIKDLPPGDYTIEAWHQRLAPQKVPVKISSADETVEANFTFSRPDKR